MMILDHVFSVWHEQAGVFSAQPGAPVIPEKPRRFPRFRRGWRRREAAARGWWSPGVSAENVS